MIKTLSKAQKMEREKFRIPRSVQDAIPIRRIFADGIFQVGNQYSKTWSFTDINYAIASKEDKTSMFLDYSELLNALDSGASAKITIYNRRINKAEFERSVLLPDKADGLDEYRHEFNKMLTAQVTGTSNSIVRERYLTVSVVKRNADEARSYFARVSTDLVTHLAQLSSVAQELTLTERLHIFRDFFKAGEQAAAEFNIHEHAKRGQHFKDWFCPDSMEFAADHFKVDARYGRVLYLQDYASYIKDRVVRQFVFDFCIQLSGQDCQIICMDDKLGMREQCKDLRLIGTGVAFNRHNGFAAACTQGVQFLFYGIGSPCSMVGGADLYGGEAPVRVSRGIRHKRHLLSDILYDIINIHGSGINVNTFLNKIKISNYIFTSCRLHGILDSEVLCGINLRCDNVFARRTPETAHQQGGQI